MEKYREKLRMNLAINAAAVAALIAVQILGYSRALRPAVADAHWADMWNGFITGAAFGIMAIFSVGIIRVVRALRDEKYLRKLYIRENDERKKQIATAARSAGAQLFLVAGLVAGVAAGFFSVTASVAIIACVFANSLMCMGFKLYYSRKF